MTLFRGRNFEFTIYYYFYINTTIIVLFHNDITRDVFPIQVHRNQRSMQAIRVQPRRFEFRDVESIKILKREKRKPIIVAEKRLVPADGIAVKARNSRIWKHVSRPMS